MVLGRHGSERGMTEGLSLQLQSQRGGRERAQHGSGYASYEATLCLVHKAKVPQSCTGAICGTLRRLRACRAGRRPERWRLLMLQDLLFRLLDRTLVGGDGAGLGTGDVQGAGSDSAGNGSARTYGGSILNGHRSDQLGIRADKDIIANGSAVLVGAVVIAGNSTGANIGIGADISIADIGQVT